jgi:hypothetical protein
MFIRRLLDPSDRFRVMDVGIRREEISGVRDPATRPLGKDSAGRSAAGPPTHRSAQPDPRRIVLGAFNEA